MKKLLFCWLICMTTWNIHAATNAVKFNLADFTTAPVAYKQLKITPLPSSFPRVEGTQVIGLDPIFKTTDANGLATNILVSGDYSLIFTGRFVATTIRITTPSTNCNCLLNASELTSSGTNLPGNLSAYSQAAAQVLFMLKSNGLASNPQLIGTNAATNGVGMVWTAITTNGHGQWKTNSGGSGVSDATLVTASNAVLSAAQSYATGEANDALSAANAYTAAISNLAQLKIAIANGFGTNTHIRNSLRVGNEAHYFTNLPGTGTPNELTLIHSNGGANSLAVMNLDATGFSAYTARDTNNQEHMALGFFSQAPGSGSVFDWAVYLQTWGPNSITLPMPRFVLTHDGNLKNDITGNSNFEFYQRMSLETNLTTEFWKGIPFGTAQEPALTISNNHVTLSRGGSSSYNNELRAVDPNASISLRENAESLNTGLVNANGYYTYGGTLANNGGHKFYSGGARAAQTKRFQISDDVTLNLNGLTNAGAANFASAVTNWAATHLRSTLNVSGQTTLGNAYVITNLVFGANTNCVLVVSNGSATGPGVLHLCKSTNGIIGASIHSWNLTNGFEGILTASPSTALQVTGQIRASSDIRSDRNDNLALYASAGGVYAAGVVDNYFAGRVGIGTTTPSSSLDVTGRVSISVGSSTNKARVGGTLTDFTTDAANVTTAETDLYSFMVQTNTLSVDKDKLTFEVAGKFTGGTSTKQLKVYWSGTAVFDSGALGISSAADWHLRGFLIRSNATVVRASVTLNTSFASLSSYSQRTDVSGLTLTTTNIFRLTGTAAGVGAASADIAANQGTIEWKPSGPQ